MEALIKRSVSPVVPDAWCNRCLPPHLYMLLSQGVAAGSSPSVINRKHAKQKNWLRVQDSSHVRGWSSSNTAQLYVVEPVAPWRYSRLEVGQPTVARGPCNLPENNPKPLTVNMITRTMKSRYILLRKNWNMCIGEFSCIVQEFPLQEGKSVSTICWSTYIHISTRFPQIQPAAEWQAAVAMLISHQYVCIKGGIRKTFLESCVSSTWWTWG